MTATSDIAALPVAAERAFRGIDVWVNNAGLGVIGSYPEAPLNLHRRTIEVNLLGAMHAAHAVLPRPFMSAACFPRRRHARLRARSQPFGSTGRTCPYLYAPETVAETIVGLLRRPRDEVTVGWPARAARLGYGLAPGLTVQVIGTKLRTAMNRAGPARVREGGVRRPIPAGTSASGGWRKRRGVPEAHRINMAIGAALLGAAAMAIAASRRLR